MRLDEQAFEAEIARWLVDQGGYTPGSASFFDREIGIDTAELLAFIGATQIDQWSRLIALHGGDADTAQRAFCDRLALSTVPTGTRAT
jgi:type I restriction enzyme R subunit